MRKVTVDLDQLVEDGVLTPPEADEIATYGRATTMEAGVQFLLGILIVGLIGATIALDRELRYLPFWSVGLTLAGIAASVKLPREYKVLSHTAVVIGTLAFSVYILANGNSLDGLASTRIQSNGWMQVAFLCLIVGVISRNVLLIGAAVLATTPILSLHTAYSHASYGFILERPAMTILWYGSAAIATGVASMAFQKGTEALVSRTVFAVSFFLVNFAFWVGALWGDRELAQMIGATSADALPNRNMAEMGKQFALTWAGLSIAVMAWAFYVDRRAIVILALVFLAINGYTQAHEYLFRDATTVIAVCATGIALVLAAWHYYKMPRRHPQGMVTA